MLTDHLARYRASGTYRDSLARLTAAGISVDDADELLASNVRAAHAADVDHDINDDAIAAVRSILDGFVIDSEPINATESRPITLGDIFGDDTLDELAAELVARGLDGHLSTLSATQHEAMVKTLQASGLADGPPAQAAFTVDCMVAAAIAARDPHAPAATEAEAVEVVPGLSVNRAELEAARLATSDPGAFTPRIHDIGNGERESISRWAARAVLIAGLRVVAHRLPAGVKQS